MNFNFYVHELTVLLKGAKMWNKINKGRNTKYKKYCNISHICDNKNEGEIQMNKVESPRVLRWSQDAAIMNERGSYRQSLNTLIDNNRLGIKTTYIYSFLH